MAEINVTPMVDVMLVLLIIFMVTAPLLATGVQVDLPESKAAALEQDDEPVAISIDAAGAVFVDDTPVAADALGRPARARSRRAIARAGRPAHLPARRPGPRLRPGHAGDGRDQPRRPAPGRPGQHRAGAGGAR